MALSISRTDAKLNIETTKSVLTIQSRQAKLDLRHKEAMVDVHTELPRVEIDQYECFATSGLMGPVDLTRSEAQRALQQALTYTSKVAADGDSMAAIENSSSPMPDIVERDAYPEHEFGLDYMPKARPKITVTGGIQLAARRNAEGISNGVEGTITPGDINIRYTPSQVKISMQQYASLNIKNVRNGFGAFI